MNEQIKEIALRLRGLRDMLNISIDEIATCCKVSAEEYEGYESGKNDIPIGVLENISKKYNIGLTALLFGDEPHMKSFCLTRAGQGTAMERTQAYKYQALASGFTGRKADPFIVSIEPDTEEKPIHLNSHSGQEMNYVLQGKMLLSVGGHELILNEGDSLYFDATLPHGMKALDGKTVKFLAVIL
ncbi:helix-turn-helix domain-containing protein [Draconibacterium halophilum]|uniref:Cupin domain-containing protein n=1 Tax=Draconibacterium halophilum TaxID=2706887 RepID=A0A6C0RE93_9BACT|nr:XRE family transcriptional regulator [Draconibacterium halophilum]QIA08690.1 cupin domain-containing protein [Draconibacterium halophilum]